MDETVDENKKIKKDPCTFDSTQNIDEPLYLNKHLKKGSLESNENLNNFDDNVSHDNCQSFNLAIVKPEQGCSNIQVKRQKSTYPAVTDSSVESLLDTDLGDHVIDDLPEPSQKKKVVKNDVTTLHECEKCHNTFPTKNGLSAHLISHGIYQCHECQIDFSLLNDLQAHVQDLDHFQCYVCGEIFVSSSELKCHVCTKQREDSTKSFSCDICLKKFVIYKFLSDHTKREHSGETFMCKKCEKTFDSVRILRKHFKRSHAEKIHKCSKCQNSFATGQKLISHFRQFHREKNFKCIECQSAFTRKKKLIIHFKKSHPYISQT